MAPNRLLHRNTHNIVLILFYAFLEWILIFLIFLNSLFSYLIRKFANYFGLKPPCVFCSRLDHIFDPNSRNKLSYEEIFCETHADEISNLSYCKTHKKLIESTRICSDCSDRHNADSDEMLRRKFDFVSWMGEEKNANSELGLQFCSCCENSLTQKPYPGYLLLKPSIWGETLDYKQNCGLILEMIDEDKIGDGFENSREFDSPDFKENDEDETKKDDEQENSGEVLSDVESYGLSLREVSEEDGSRSHSMNFTGNEEENDSFPIFDLNGNQFVACDRDRLVPVELIDSSTIKNREGEEIEEDDPNFATMENHPLDEIPENKTETEQEGKAKEACNETIEEKLSETPRSLRNLNFLHLLSTEESMDGSSVSEMDGGDPSLTIERLRASVKTEREALRALYTELEEERNASAISANQTMAMITRLQEEKAKMQMEALQYQRMMEEQFEYDQEALQLLNDLMIKREKEKEELEKELEVYREKVLEYETKDSEMRIVRNIVTDDEMENEDSGDIDLEEVTSECVKHMSLLDESLSEFEEERLEIINQLKILEEKLLILEDGEEKEDRTGFSERLTMASMAKSLLPLLDAAEDGEEDESEFAEREFQMGFSDNDLDEKKLEIIEQVDGVYERLQALETDGEFLKHCVGSIKNGDKGTDLLQEVLQHLRDLKAIELRETNTA